MTLITEVRIIPEWFPGGGYKRTAQEWRKNLLLITEKPYQFVMDRMVRHIIPYYVTPANRQYVCTPNSESRGSRELLCHATFTCGTEREDLRG